VTNETRKNLVKSEGGVGNEKKLSLTTGEKEIRMERLSWRKNRFGQGRSVREAGNLRGAIVKRKARSI